MEESIIRGAYDLDLGSTGPIAHPARHPWKARPPARQEPPGALEGACFFFFFFSSAKAAEWRGRDSMLPIDDSSPPQ